MEIKNLKKAGARILKAANDKETIVLYGDNDMDGACSVIIIEEVVRSLGGKVSAVHFPNRVVDGYGLNETALERLKKFSPGLLVVLDCGIGNFRQIKLAREMGFYTVIIDHHQVLGSVPEADIVVDPKQPGDRYAFKDFATVGIVFRLAELMLKKRMSSSLRKNLVELAALATIADAVPQVGENRRIIDEGLDQIEASWRPGIRALFEADFLHGSFRERVSRVISLLHARDFEKGSPVCFRILTEPSLEKAREMVPRLYDRQEARKQDIREAVEKLKRKIADSKSPVIFEGGDLDFTIISPVASHLCDFFKKPTFIFTRMEKETEGTVRSPSSIDSVALMSRCKKYTITYGGHAQASGFRLKNENLEDFKKCLIENFSKL